MPVLVVAEHFDLPDRFKDQIDSRMSKLEDLLPPDSIIRLFLKKCARHGYEGVISVHSVHEDLTYSESGDDLKELINSLKSHIKRQLVSRKEKRIHRRRKSAFAPPYPAVG